MEEAYIRGLEESVTTLSGVGPAARKGYEGLGIETKSDLLALSPRSFEDHSKITPIDAVADGGFANTRVMVLRHDFFGGRSFSKRTLKIQVRDCEGKGHQLSLLCFGRNFMEKTIQVGGVYYFYGQIQSYNGRTQCTQFELKRWDDPDDPPPEWGKILPVYPLHTPLTERNIRRDVTAVLSSVVHFKDELPEKVVTQYHLLSMDEAIRQLHRPQNMEKYDSARRTLAFDELFYMQLLTRRGHAERKGNEISKPNKTELKLIESLPFSLTKDQMTSLSEIRKDLDSEEPMNRLLQGDVGSGKTLVAWISALHVVAEKKQVAFMAPTELLARQHADSAAALIAPLGVRLAFLTGAVKGKARKELLGQIADGNVDIIIGTHALFSKEVVFHNLGYVIIDEQHRFGVEQRLALTGKAQVPDLLLMTATPIPRTLSLTVFGSLNVSTLKTMPPGRKPVITYLVLESSRQRMYDSIAVEFRRGHQAYFVYPRIDDTGESELRDVTTMFDYLQKQYPGVPSALMHSKLEEEEKMDILERFKKGELKYLVSTSVVEVGIDIPNATCMVIEHADRFGLAALHQLRGRVGRSSLQSYCFLVFSKELSDVAKQRLSVMKQTTDGFEIAEKDLEIRGAGDITGVRQSGFLDLKFASLSNNLDLLEETRDAVTAIMRDDPGLLKAENAIIRQTMTDSPVFQQPSAS